MRQLFYIYMSLAVGKPTMWPTGVQRRHIKMINNPSKSFILFTTSVMFTYGEDSEQAVHPPALFSFRYLLLLDKGHENHS